MNVVDRIVARLPRKSALYDLHPELKDRVPILRMNSDDRQDATLGTFEQNSASYTNHMWLQKAINVLKNNIAPLPLTVIRGLKSDEEYVDSHPVVRFLDSPNPDMSPEDLWGMWVVDQMNGGEWGLETVRNGRGQPLELWPHQPNEYSVIPASLRYRRVSAYKVDDGAGDPYNLTPEEFIHFKFYNPLQPFRGLSPVSAVRLSIQIDQLAQAWSRLFFKNNARPDFAVIAPEGTTATEKTEMLAKLKADNGGNNAHEPLILEDGVTDIKVFSWPAKDMEWVNQREMSRDEVSAIVGVPDEIMGYGRDTYENFGTAEVVLWRVTILPLCGLRDGTLTRYFRKIGMLQANERIITDTRDIPQLQEDKSEKIDQVNKLFTVGVPVNQASDFIGLGLPPVPGGDIGYLNSSMVPVDQLPVQPGGGLILSTQPAKVKVFKTVGEYGSAEHEAVYKKLQARLDAPVSALKIIAKKEFQRQQNDINRRLREGKVFGRGKFKASEDISSPADLFDPEEEARLWVAALKKKLFEAVQRIGNDELGTLGIAGAFDVDRPEVQKAIGKILSTVAKKVNDTTWENLTDLFREAEQAGEGIPAIQERLSTYFGDRKSDYQTERIARTTMTGASNSGTVQAWGQAEDDGVKLQKQWVSALQPDRTRESHAEAHGQTVGLHEMFEVGGESLAYPGDPNGSPENIINCLCTQIAIVEE